MATSSISHPELAALAISDPPERWAALGFAVAEGRLHVGGVELQLGVPGQGITGWTLRGLSAPMTDIDGLATATPSQSLVTATTNRLGVGGHPNGAIGIDHVVVLTPDFDRTATALERSGLALRRIRDAGGFRQGFRRLGPAILELVEVKQAPPGPARFWGLVVIVPDLAALHGRLAPHLGEPRPAVQPSRQIATLRESAGLAPQVAFMDPE